MRFSIVIPVYNTEQFLPRCLDSLMAQTCQDFEVVIVDDCSQGDCRAIVARYDDRFGIVRHEKNRGTFRARCTGVRAAKGEYVVPVDPDDYLLPETLGKVLGVIDRDSPDVVSYWMDCDDGRKIYPHWCRHPREKISAEDELRSIIRHTSNYSIVSKVVRRSIALQSIDNLSMPEQAYMNVSEDFLMTIAVLLTCKSISHLDYAGYRYFLNPKSVTHSRQDADGLRHACSQSRLVYDAIRAMCARVARTGDVPGLVEQIIAISEGWFCQEVMEGAPDLILPLSEILFEVFPADAVGHAFASGYAQMRSSRAYRVGKMLSRIVRLRIA